MVTDETATEGSFQVKAQSELPSRGGAETVTGKLFISRLILPAWKPNTTR